MSGPFFYPTSALTKYGCFGSLRVFVSSNALTTNPILIEGVELIDS